MGEPRLFVGVDWGSETHQVHVMQSDGESVGERAVRHEGAAIQDLCGWLAQLAVEPAQVGIAIETPRGPVVEALLERGFSVYSINPKQLDRFRDRFTVAGAKDDRRDALVLASSLRTDRHAFRLLQVDDALVIELREWSRMLEEQQEERQRLMSRIRDQLWRYYPQMSKLGDLDDEWVLAVWEMAPTPARVKHLRRTKIEDLLKSHRIRRIDADEVLRILKEPPLHVARGTTEAASAHIERLVARLRLLNQHRRESEKRLDELCDKLGESTKTDGAEGQKSEQRDVEILRSLPGVGRIVLATLLAEATRPLQERDYHALRSLCGVAPVTQQSGKSRVVMMRYACCKRLRNAVYHWARIAMQRDPVSRAKYKQLRARGQTHGRALRAVADRLLGVACVMLRKQTSFDHQRQSTPAAAA